MARYKLVFLSIIKYFFFEINAIDNISPFFFGLVKYHGIREYFIDILFLSYIKEIFVCDMLSGDFSLYNYIFNQYCSFYVNI